MELQLRLVAHKPITRQIYDQIRAAVLEGRLARGSHLPSTRELADQLNVARKTVVQAYDMLWAEGFVVTKVGSGTFVQELSIVRRDGAASRTPLAVSPLWRELPALPAFPLDPVRFDLGLGVPDLTHFPWKLWRSLSASRLRLIRGVDNSYVSAQGYGPLRDAIASAVRFSRAVHCAPNDVLITNGAQQALHLVAQVMLPPGAVVAMEDPGYPMARSIFLAHGARVSDVPLDREGIIVERLPRDAKLVYTTPSHQFPTGVVMSYERRVQLLEWARKRGAAIIEDDYDSEFRFDGRLLEALQSIDPSVVIYIGTFSKSLFPGIRLGFAISPQPLREPLVVAKQLTDWHSPLVTQATAAAFISEGHYMRHVRKVRRVYAERRTRLMTEVEAHLADWLELLPSSTGLHFAATFRHGDNAEAFADAALSAGVRMIPMPNGLTFGIGSIEVPHIKEAIKIVRGVASEQCRRDPRREIGRRK